MHAICLAHLISSVLLLIILICNICQGVKVIKPLVMLLPESLLLPVR